MYVTRPRSLYRNHPGALWVQPEADVPYSGHLVVSDKDSVTMDSFCCGLWRNGRIKRLPFPSDRFLHVVHSTLHEEASVTKAWFIPVLDQPLSSNRYYVIKAKGRNKGQAYTCSREGESGMCCFKRRRFDSITRPFDHRDRYQMFEIRPYPSGGYFARSVEWDGYPPSFLGRGGWEVDTSPSFKLRLRETLGLRDSTIPSELPGPELTLPLRRSTPVVIGRWYCPFVFVKEENMRVDDQMRKSLVYELSLKQWWEQIHSAENEDNQNNVVVVDARVKRLLCLVEGAEAEKDDRREKDGYVWFRVKEHCRRETSAGLSSCMFEKMRWLQEMRGWFDGEREVKVSGRKEITGRENGWRKFGCYVLVESFVLRRMDGTLLINFSFKNTQKIVCKWE